MSKVIYITRDGRDVALSLMQQPWGPGNIYACAKLWKNYIEKKHILHELIPSEQILEDMLVLKLLEPIRFQESYRASDKKIMEQLK